MGTINRSCTKSDLMIVVQSSGPAGCAILRDIPPVWPLLADSRARRSEQMGWQRTHTHRLGGRAVTIYFVHHAEGIFSRATGVVWLILILVQSDRERKKQKQKQNKTKNISVLAPPGLCRGLPIRDVPMTQQRPQILNVYRRSR